MRLEITVTVSTDDRKTSQTAENVIRVATDVPGVPVSASRSDFMDQAATLIRAITDNQLPALYDAVDQMASNPSVESMREQMQKLRKKAGDPNADVQEDDNAQV